MGLMSQVWLKFASECCVCWSICAGLEVLQPAIARLAMQQQLGLEDCAQLLFLASAAAVCVAAASKALHVSLTTFLCFLF